MDDALWLLNEMDIDHWELILELPEGKNFKLPKLSNIASIVGIIKNYQQIIKQDQNLQFQYYFQAKPHSSYVAAIAGKINKIIQDLNCIVTQLKTPEMIIKTAKRNKKSEFITEEIIGS